LDLDNPLVDLTYNWNVWYTNMIAAADVVNAANPNILIFLSGLLGDLTLTPIPLGTNLSGGFGFNKNGFSYADKLLLELHNYMNDISSCAVLEAYLYTAGFDAMDTGNPLIKNLMPVVMTEFGYAQDASDVQSTCATCLKGYLPAQTAGWMVWVFAGSYYIWEGTQEYGETYGKFLSMDLR
jgi:hypothetical protein